jgi:cysteine synthase
MRADRSIIDTIGNMPVIRLNFKSEQLRIYAKCEFLNPSGSIKDRFARCVIDDAEQRGVLHDDSIILECSSGNTGIALAMLGAARGYPVTIVMPRKASCERSHLIRQFGGTVVTFDSDGYQSGVELTHAMAARDDRYFLPRQFENPLNALDHEHSTGVEILAQVSCPIDGFVAGYGTGGTLAGISRALRRANRQTRIYAMEPAEAALLLGETPCCHSIEGLAAGSVPALLNDIKFDGVLTVKSIDAQRMAQRLSREFGLLVGTSSGANVAAALNLARQMGQDSTVVTVLCDRAERYFSTPLFGGGRTSERAHETCASLAPVAAA